jgi:DNA-binding response OmpR family regulator
VATILIVEDNKPLNQLYAEVLKMSGFDILQAANCKEAMECLQRAIPEIVVLDMLLPDGNGQSVISYMRENLDLQKTHIIAVSGFQGDVNDADGLEVDHFLMKPVAIPTLVDCVDRIINHKK